MIVSVSAHSAVLTSILPMPSMRTPSPDPKVIVGGVHLVAVR
jgi:hypothetical protein